MKKHVKVEWFVVAIALLVLSTNLLSHAQGSPSSSIRQLRAPSSPAIVTDSESVPDGDIEFLKKDLRSQKKQVVAANMDLSDAEAEKFWPVYDKYATELATIYDSKLSLIGNYANNYETMNGDEAEAYLRQRAAIEQQVMQLRLKYVPEFRKVLSGRQTARFFQIDWRLDLLINLQLSQASIIDP